MTASMKQRRSIIVAAGLGALAAGTGRLAFADQYPSKPIRLIVPFPPGGPADVLGRMMARALQGSLPVSCYVDNKGGAGGTIGMAAVASAAPDGYTIGLASTTTTAISPGIYTSLNYKVADDFAPIGEFARVPLVLAVAADSGITSLADLKKLANSRSGGVFYGSGGEGTQTHLAGEIFKSKLGIVAQHVPYKGGNPAMMGMLSNEVTFVLDTVAASLPLVGSNKIRVIAILGKDRSFALPAVSTAEEQGIVGLDVVSWNGLVAPGKTPRDIVAVLNAAIKKGLTLPDVVDAIGKAGATPSYSSADAFKALIDNDTKAYASVIETAGIKHE